MDNKIYGLLGRKLSHSYSVPIHKALGIPDYRLIELEPDELNAFMKQDNIGGLNVTIPYKVSAMKYCDTLSPEAHDIGSVNTIVNTDGVLAGFNTDAYGFMYMAKNANISFVNRKVLVLGSGGASLTAKYCADILGTRETIIISRSGENNYQNINRHYDAEIIINATPVGMYPNNGISPINLSGFKKCAGVIDMIYNPLRTELLQQAERLGINCCNGLSMLVAQAKASQEIFFSKNIHDSEIQKVLSGLHCAMENIVLIGMPGCGKTTVGKVLSDLTGRECIDIDKQIEKSEGCTIPEIFSSYGENKFRQLEHEEIVRAGCLSGKIITTGGGVIKDADNYRYLHQNGRIYFLERELSLLETDGRPLSKSGDLNEMYKSRLPLYKRFCDLEIKNAASPESTAEAVWRDYCENTRY